MKRILLIFIILIIALFTTVSAYNYGGVNYPVPRNNYVNDYADVLSSEAENAIWNRLENLERNSGLEMTVVTIKTLKEFAPSSTSIEEYATGLFNNWRVGNRNNNKGVMLLVIPEDKKCRIEIGAGYSSMYNTVMKRVVDEAMIPHFKAGNYEIGIESGIEEVVMSTTEKVGFFKYYFVEMMAGMFAIVAVFAGISCILKGRNGWGWGFFTIGFSILGFILFRIMLRRGSSSSFGGGYSSGGGASGSW